MGFDRLLHELDVQALVLHLVEQLDGLLGAPGLVGIDADANVVAYLFADRHETGHIQRGIGAHLDLQGVIAAVYCVAGVTGHLFGGIDADGDVGDNLGAATPQKLIHNGPITLHRAMSYQLDLSRQDLLLTTLTGAWAREFEPDTAPVRRGRTVFGSVSGTSGHYCNPFFALSDPNTGEHSGEIYGFNLIYSGSYAASVEADSYGSLRIMAGVQSEGFHWTLVSGESFLTPEAVLTFSIEGRNGLRHNMHRFVTSHILPSHWREKTRPILVNNWEATYFDFTPRKLRALAAKAAGLGAELFVLDDGWFGRRTDDTRGLGDFDPNLKKLPSGLDGLAQDLKAKGLSFGLWVEPEMVSQDSALYEEHPDWAVVSPGVSPSLGRNQLVLDLCRKEVQDYLITQLNTLLDSTPICYIKWDMNRHHTDRFSTVLLEQGRFAHTWTMGPIMC